MNFGVRLSAVTLDRGTCSLQLNGANASRLNLALVTPETGECVRPGECYVPIDRGAGGWKEENGRVQLPSFICKLLNKNSLRLATSTEVCAAKEESNPICTPKVGDPVPPDTSNATAVRVVPEDFATSTVFFGESIYFASSSRVGKLNLLDPSAVGTQVPNVAVAGSAKLPWRFSTTLLGTLALANGTAEGFVISGEGNGDASKVTIADGTIDVTPFTSSEFAWAVQGTDGTGGIYTSGFQGIATKVPLPLTSVTSVLTGALQTGAGDSVIVGGADGSLRACTIPEQCHPAATVSGGGRIEGLSPLFNGTGVNSGYILAASGIYRAAFSGNQVSITNFVAADLSGIDEGNLHYARGIANNNNNCVFFTSNAGLSYAVDGGGATGVAKLLVPAMEGRPFLGIAFAPSVAGLSIYYTVFASRDQDGGVWRVPVPQECNAPPAGEPDGGTFVPPDGGAQIACNAQSCGEGCCGPGGCILKPVQNATYCGIGGNTCMPCNVGAGEDCDRGTGTCVVL